MRVSENLLIGGEPLSNDIQWLSNFTWALAGGFGNFLEDFMKIGGICPKLVHLNNHSNARPGWFAVENFHVIVLV